MKPRTNPFSRMRFLVAAVNEHGVHSPFIFRFLTCALYQKDAFRGPQAERVLLKALAYFPIERVHIPAEANSVRRIISERFPELLFEQEPFDLVYCISPSVPELKALLPHLHNDSIVLVDGLRESKASLASWENLKALQEVRVSLDLFYSGFLFFRREQARQHFKIRR